MNRARDVRRQYVKLMDRVEIVITSDASNSIAIRKAITAGYFYNTSRCVTLMSSRVFTAGSPREGLTRRSSITRVCKSTPTVPCSDGRQGFVPVFRARIWPSTGTSINDLAAANDGKLYLATDDGIYIMDDGAVYRHLTGSRGSVHLLSSRP